jgi:hypothetical protein
MYSNTAIGYDIPKRYQLTRAILLLRGDRLLYSLKNVLHTFLVSLTRFCPSN